MFSDGFKWILRYQHVYIKLWKRSIWNMAVESKGFLDSRYKPIAISPEYIFKSSTMPWIFTVETYVMIAKKCWVCVKFLRALVIDHIHNHIPWCQFFSDLALTSILNAAYALTSKVHLVTMSMFNLLSIRLIGSIPKRVTLSLKSQEVIPVFTELRIPAILSRFTSRFTRHQFSSTAFNAVWFKDLCRKSD